MLLGIEDEMAHLFHLNDFGKALRRATNLNQIIQNRKNLFCRSVPAAVRCPSPSQEVHNRWHHGLIQGWRAAAIVPFASLQQGLKECAPNAIPRTCGERLEGSLSQSLLRGAGCDTRPDKPLDGIFVAFR